MRAAILSLLLSLSVVSSLDIHALKAHHRRDDPPTSTIGTNISLRTGNPDDLISCTDPKCGGPGDDPDQNPQCRDGSPCVNLAIPATAVTPTFISSEAVASMASEVFQEELQHSFDIPTTLPTTLVTSGAEAFPTLLVPSMTHQTVASGVIGYWTGSVTMPPDSSETDGCDPDDEDEDEEEGDEEEE
ncbi:MAG: hypothetical protein Q9227_001333 [Pyrenula ochraceoflavens]